MKRLLRNQNGDIVHLQTPQYSRMTSDEGEFVFFVPNTAYKSQNDTDRKLQELLKKLLN